MLRFLNKTILAVGLALASVACAHAEVSVFAAASLKGALEEVAEAFSAHTDVRISFGSSATMARQISLGAPADLFISANEAWMDDLDRRGLIATKSRSALLGNNLVLVSAIDPAPVTDWSSLSARLDGQRLALAQVDAAPAGIYAKQALTALGVWEDVAPQVVQADNVRGALAFAATGAVKFAIVYRTDAQAEQRVHVLGQLPAATHDPIRYPVALIQGRENEQAKAFLDFLTSDAAASIFSAHGFAALGDTN